MKTYEKSLSLLKRGRIVTPLASQTYSKSFRYFCEGQAPAFLDRGLGSHVWDVDGNEYIDFICALGPVTIGYNDSRVNQAIKNQLEKGISFSLASPVEVELAEKLVSIVPGAEMVRFVKNGSDATSAAVRLARAYTGRDHVAICGYHGMQDWYIGSTANNLGVPKAVRDMSHNFQYNQLSSLEDLFEKFPEQIAVVILEPIQSNGPDPEFLESIRTLTHDQGALLVFDEVVSGFRYALGGAAELYKVIPDMTAFGKGLGNGMPVSAVSGRKDLLELIDTKGVFISTTFGGEALSLAASLETIRILEQPGAYEKIWSLGKLLMDALKQGIKQYSLDSALSVSGLPPHGGVLFEGVGSLNYLDINSVFQQRLIDEGILSVGINNISLAHTEEDIQAFISAADLAMQDVKKAMAQDSLEGILSGGKVNPVFKRNIR